MEFQTRPMVEYGKSSCRNFCEGLKRKMMAASRKSRGLGFEEEGKLKGIFQTWPGKIKMMEPSSTPSSRLGNRATMASITPGRKESTGMDCRMSKRGIMTISARLEFAAI